MDTKRIVTASINGAEISVMADNRMSLLEMLRDAAGLTGTKEGCMTGDCGACSVMMNGRVVDSCLVMAAEAEGAEIETVEGIADGKNLHPLQRKFLEHAALQCGICTPGFLVSAKALLEKNPDPSDAETRYWLAGNLCRCTGYQQIIDAVRDAAAEMRSSAK
ncbi:MAG: (2Fe-2S)-binding protein [SAR324 cluster bacterium]|nr:(2Fe-2S)-binding protein [SAR324 cluster bacterium]MCH8885716.1 (2Fe-2S)-binding protein [SAR324 cluster bacterium]